MFVDAETIRYLWPEIILIVMASWIYLAGAFQPHRVWWTYFSLAVYGIVGYALLGAESSMWTTDVTPPPVSGPLRIDYMGFVLRCFAVLVGILFTLMGARGSNRNLTSEFLATVMVTGLMLVARANEFGVAIRQPRTDFYSNICLAVFGTAGSSEFGSNHQVLLPEYLVVGLVSLRAQFFCMASPAPPR